MAQTRKIVVIMFTDIVGYTSLMGRDEDMALDILRKSKQLHRKCLRHFNGKFLKEMGDGILCSFETVTDAVYCGGKLMKEIKTIDGLELKVGINMGEVIEDGKEMYGDGINIASRIEGLARSNQILVTESIYKIIRNRTGIEYTFEGEHKLKNVGEGVKVYSINVQDIPDGALIKPRQLSKYIPWAVGVAVLVLGTILLLNVLSSTSSGENLSIAVLPFDDMSPEGDQEYLGDGIAEELITVLSQAKDLRVIARTSSFQFKGESIDLTDVGRRLGVRYLVEGSVMKADRKIRITVQLIDATTNEHVWATSYDRQFGGIFALRDEIAKKVSEEIGTHFNIAFPMTHVVDPNAYENVLKGRHLLRRFYVDPNPELLDHAEEALLESIEHDSSYAEAYAALADVYHWKESRVYKVSRGDSAASIDYTENEKVMIERAMDLDSSSGYVNRIYGIYWQMHFGWDKAHYYYSRAIELNPNDPVALGDLAWILSMAGLHDEADALYDRAIDLDPVDAGLLIEIGQLDRFRGRIDKARKHLEDVLLLSPANRQALGHLVMSNYLVGDDSTADAYLERVMSLNLTKDQRERAKLPYYAAHGYRDSVFAVSNSLTIDLYSLLGMWDECMRRHEDYIAASNPHTAFYYYYTTIEQDPQVHPAFLDLYRHIFNHPRFPAFMEEMKRRYRQNLKRYSVKGSYILEN